VEMVGEQKYIPCIGRDHSRRLEEDLEAFCMLCCRNCSRASRMSFGLRFGGSSGAGARIALSLFETRQLLCTEFQKEIQLSAS
jgi:hypothetical protein